MTQPYLAPRTLHQGPPILPLRARPLHHAYCSCTTTRPLGAYAATRGGVARIASYDPTHTTTERNRFVGEMNRRWRTVRGLIRRAIVDQDCLALAAPAPHPRLATHAAGLPGHRAFDFHRSADKVEAFNAWLQEMIDANILEQVTLPGFSASGIEPQRHTWWGNVYIQSAYQKGISAARRDMLATGYPLPPDPTSRQALQAAFNQPFHVDRAGLVYVRAYEELRGVTTTTATQLSRVLAQGMAEGRGPADIARRMNKAISGIGGTLALTDTLGRFIPAERRAVLIARTEVIRAHHLANIQELRALGAVGVSVQAELRTAGDDRVCEECASLHGQRYTLDEIENMIPVHPQCRCKAFPVPYDEDDAAPEAEAEAEAGSGSVAERYTDPEHRRLYEEAYAEYRPFFDTLTPEDYAVIDGAHDPDRFMELNARLAEKLENEVAPLLYGDYGILAEWQDDTRTFHPTSWKAIAARLEPDAPFYHGDADVHDTVRAWLERDPAAVQALTQDHLRLRAFNQAYMDARGIESVTLYRGMSGGTARSIKENALRAWRGEMHRTRFTVTDSSLTGYTTDFRTADLFGTDLVWRREVPAADIVLHRDLFSFVTEEYMDEAEFLVVGGERELTFRDVYTSISENATSRVWLGEVDYE